MKDQNKNLIGLAIAGIVLAGCAREQISSSTGAVVTPAADQTEIGVAAPIEVIRWRSAMMMAAEYVRDGKGEPEILATMSNGRPAIGTATRVTSFTVRYPVKTFSIGAVLLGGSRSIVPVDKDANGQRCIGVTVAGFESGRTSIATRRPREDPTTCANSDSIKFEPYRELVEIAACIRNGKKGVLEGGKSFKCVAN